MTTKKAARVNALTTFALVLAILMVGLTTWMMFGKRAQVMVQRVRILTNVVR